MTSADAATSPGHPDLTWLVSLARRLARPGDDADDLAQQTWLVAMEQHDPAKAASRPWLAGVLRNLRRMRARTDVRRSAREADVAAPDAPSPEDALARLETLDALRAALGELDALDRKLVLGRYAAGHTAVQLGDQFELLPSTVRTRLSRATQRLRADVVARCGAACFVPWAVPDVELLGGTAAATGAVAMSATTKIVLGATVLAALGLGASQLQSAPAASPSQSSVVASSATNASTPARGDRVSAGSERRAQLDRARQHKLDEIRAARTARLAVGSHAAEPPTGATVVTDACDDGCMGTLGMQLSIARAISGCRDELPEGTVGKSKFRVQLIAEPDAGAVVESIAVEQDELGVAAFTECVLESAPLAELHDPEHPVSDDFTFRYTMGQPGDISTEFLSSFPDLLAAHPEFAAMMARPPGAPPSSDDATAFAKWIDGDAQAQAVFGQWAAEEGADLAKVSID